MSSLPGLPSALAAALLLSLLSAGRAEANPHELPFTYPYMTLQQGQLEFEQSIDITPIPTVDDVNKLPNGFGARTTLVSELELGLTDRLEASLYLVLGNTSQQPGIYKFYRYAGIKERLRYRLFDPGVLPVDISIYLEAEQYQNVFELEWKLNFERRLGRFRLLLNLWAAHEFYHHQSDPSEAPGQANRQEWEINPTGGVAYSISPNFSAGVEDWLHTEFGATGFASHGQPFLVTPVYNYVGPTAMFQTGPFWISAAFYTRVTQLKTDVHQGDVYGRFWFRTMLGINL
jgi:hypothetical protein